MLSLEQEIKKYLQDQQIQYHDHSGGETRFRRLDFGFGDVEQKRYFRFDAKEKRRHYNLKNWPDCGIPEQYLFIIDDLAARKILAFAPNSGLLVRDNTSAQYYLFTVVDLYLMPKVRVNRPIRNIRHGQKGKWLIDLRNGYQADALGQVFQAIASYLDNRQAIYHEELACYGSYEGESVEQGGIARRPEHWNTDISETR